MMKIYVEKKQMIKSKKNKRIAKDIWIKKQEDYQNKGITLIALVITIIILLILAGITIIAITGDNGLIKNAENAKEQTEIDNEKEIVDTCTIQTMGENKYGNITKEDLQRKLDTYTGEGLTEVLYDGEDTLYVYFTETKRYYTVDIDGIINGPVTVDRAEDKYPGDFTKDENGNELSGDTEDDAYQINCIEDLCALSNYCNNPDNQWSNNTFSGKYIVLTKNLDFKSDLSYINGQIDMEGNIPSCSSIEELKEILTTGDGFYPVGASINEFNTTFRGHFNGNYYTISNLYENNESGNQSGNLGLFGSCWSADIRNISVQGEIIGKDNNAGGITAYSRGCTFVNCINKVNVTVSGSAGGICGYTFNDGSKFINCANYGEISGGSFSAGILGWDWSTYSKIYNCINANKSSVGIVKNIYTNNSIEVFNVLNMGECSSVIAGNISQIANCFNLEGCTDTLGNDAIVEYSEEVIKSEEFVNMLNTFIETGGNGSNIDTTDWAKWVYNENDFPTLDIETIWDGTEWK